MNDQVAEREPEQEQEPEPETMTSLELSNAFGREHMDVLRLLRRMISEDSLIRAECFYKSSPYITPDGEEALLLVIDFNMAMAFAAEHRNRDSARFIECIRSGKSVKNFKPSETPEQDNGYVYFFQSGPWIKIGKASNVKSRLVECQTGNPERVTLFHTIVCENMHAAELQLHDRYVSKRGIGEWFNLNDKQLAEIKKVTLLDHI